MSTTRVKMTIQGSGELEDGTRYTRKLSITETMERDGINREVSEERIEIGGEVCEVRVMRLNGEMIQEVVEDDSVRDAMEFETKWEEINWRWSRVLGYHVPHQS